MFNPIKVHSIVYESRKGGGGKQKNLSPETLKIFILGEDGREGGGDKYLLGLVSLIFLFF